eukprot:4719560-Pyramimonas_sp.AAC.1
MPHSLTLYGFPGTRLHQTVGKPSIRATLAAQCSSLWLHLVFHSASFMRQRLTRMALSSAGGQLAARRRLGQLPNK